jgi:hypothetical protein
MRFLNLVKFASFGFRFNKKRVFLGLSSEIRHSNVDDMPNEMQGSALYIDHCSASRFLTLSIAQQRFFGEVETPYVSLISAVLWSDSRPL